MPDLWETQITDPLMHGALNIVQITLARAQADLFVAEAKTKVDNDRVITRTPQLSLCISRQSATNTKSYFIFRCDNK